ncbi:cobaltochelatase subunit CobN [Mesorhizobium atlanticum]
MLPTGRNLFTSDPRTMPTPTAYDLGRAAAEGSGAQLHAEPWRLAALAGYRPLGFGLPCAPAAKRSRKAWR